jgi:hypothetical protein
MISFASGKFDIALLITDDSKSMSAERTGIIKRKKRDSESEYSELRRNENACVPELLMEFLKMQLVLL